MPSCRLVLAVASATLLVGCIDTSDLREQPFPCVDEDDCVSGYVCVDDECREGDSSSADAVDPDTTESRPSCAAPLGAPIRAPGGSSAANSPSLSPDGRWLAWHTASALAVTDKNTNDDIYALDLANPSNSMLHHVSFDGTLRPGDTRDHINPFAHDGGVLWESQGSLDPASADRWRVLTWSADGTASEVGLGVAARHPSLGGAPDVGDAQVGFVTDESESTADGNTEPDLYRSEQSVGNFLVSRNGSAATGIGDALGRLARRAPRAVFTSNDRALFDTPGFDNVVVADFSDPTATTLHVVSRDASGAIADSPVLHARISHDGTTVIFWSNASNLTSGANPGALLAWDEETDSTEVLFEYSVSDATEGSFAVDATGRFVVFSARGEFIPGVANGHAQVYMLDREAREIALVSATTSGQPGNSAATQVAVDADGCRIAFASFASNLVSGDDNSVRDVFVVDRPTEWVPFP